MSIAALVIVSACSWDNPGANPYRGSVPAAVHAYQDIPASVRVRLQARMEKHQYDEVVDIKRDQIVGANEYTELRDMHFGGGKLCQTVSRSKWAEASVERGLVYCEDEHCLIVPTVCNNVSRVTRVKSLGGGGGGAGSSLGPVPTITATPIETAVIPDPGGSSPGINEPLPPPVSFEDGVNPPPPISRSGDWSPPWIPPYYPPSFGSCCWTWGPPVDPPPIPAIPEPKTWLLFALGLAILTAFKRK